MCGMIRPEILIDNDPLLSGIIDLNNLNNNIKNVLKMANKWDEVQVQYDTTYLPTGLEDYISSYIKKNKRHSIPSAIYNSSDFEIFDASQALLIWFLEYRDRNRNVKKVGSNYDQKHESTWSHDAADPIIKFLLWGLHSISYEW